MITLAILMLEKLVRVTLRSETLTYPLYSPNLSVAFPTPAGRTLVRPLLDSVSGAVRGTC